MGKNQNSNDGEFLTEAMDRRSVLKKAATAGVIVWTAPAILSGTAHAHELPGNAVCTPACAFPDFTPQFNVRSACADEVEAVEALAGVSVNKLAIIKVVPADPSRTCPCDSQDAVVFVNVDNLTAFSKSNGTAVGCVAFADTPSNLGVTAYTGNPDEFIIYKDGAIGDGWYTGNGAICVSIGCHDEIGGDMVWRSCSFRVCFDYHPAGSACTSAGDPVETRSSPTGACVVGCVPCPT